MIFDTLAERGSPGDDSSQRPQGVPPLIHLPRRKPRLIVVGALYRLYLSSRRILPRRLLTRWLLLTSWIFDRLALEQLSYWRGPEGTLELLRPQTIRLVQEETRDARKVLDLGGGSGVVTKTLASLASNVIYADLDSHNVAAARATCAELSNVSIVLGDGLVVAEQDGPFDLICLFHVLEHLDRPTEALAALRRHGERLLIEVPDVESNWLTEIRRREGLPLHSDDDHVTEFTDRGLLECLKTAGWHVDRFEKVNGALVAVASSA
jgi:protein-L-isoaspartate O-methyltransferase